MDIDETLKEAYLRGWQDAFLLFRRNYNLVKDMPDAYEFTKPQNASTKE